MNIFLTGFTGVGKTTIGRELAATCNRPFIDLDDVIASKLDCALDHFFITYGEYAFRKMEHETLLQVMMQQTQAIIALGGGTMCHFLNHKKILANGIVVYLQMEWQELYHQLQSVAARPILVGKTEAQIFELYSQREPFYELAQLKVPINSTFSAKKVANILKLSTIR